MLVATFGPSTGWAGRSISYDGGQFILADFGPITAQQVLSYDAAEQIEWEYDGLRAWVATRDESAASVKPAPRRTPWWVWALVGVAVAVSVIAVIVLPMQMGMKAANTSDDNQSGGQNGLGADSAWVEVYRTTGGGGTYSNTSEPFTLAGGRQRLDVTVSGQSESIAVLMHIRNIESTWKSADFDASSAGSFTGNAYLKDAGQYYLETRSANCDWSAILYELR